MNCKRRSSWNGLFSGGILALVAATGLGISPVEIPHTADGIRLGDNWGEVCAVIQRFQSVTLPNVKFTDATVSSVADYLQTEIRKCDPARKGFKIEARGLKSSAVTLNVVNMPMTDLLRYCTDITAAHLLWEAKGVTIEAETVKDDDLWNGTILPVPNDLPIKAAVTAESVTPKNIRCTEFEKVRVEGEDFLLTAGGARYDRTNKVLEAKKEVRITRKGLTVSLESVRFNAVVERINNQVAK